MENVKFEYFDGLILEGILITQVKGFCKAENGEYCIVKEYDATDYCLPGGGCNLDEDPIDCLKREFMEETQIPLNNIKLIGTVLVTVFNKNGEIIEKTQHVRYYCKPKTLPDFIPRYKGFEIIKRKFIPIKILKDIVPMLRNKSGKIMINKLIKL